MPCTPNEHICFDQCPFIFQTSVDVTHCDYLYPLKKTVVDSPLCQRLSHGVFLLFFSTQTLAVDITLQCSYHLFFIPNHHQDCNFILNWNISKWVVLMMGMRLSNDCLLKHLTETNIQIPWLRQNKRLWFMSWDLWVWVVQLSICFSQGTSSV